MSLLARDEQGDLKIESDTQPQPEISTPAEVVDEEMDRMIADDRSFSTEIPASEDDGDFPEDFPDYYSGELISTLSADEKVRLEEKREDIRGRLALIYTVATFVMFLFGVLAAFFDAIFRETSFIDNLTEVLPLISGIFLGSLGFVLGYYFRKIDSEDQE